MREQLKAYIDRLFEGTVDTQQARDFHDELLQNTLDRYDEEISAGKSGEEAYRVALLSLGNPDELLKPFYPKRENTRALRTIGVVLYCTSVVPIILLGAFSGKAAVIGVAMMFAMIAAATALMIIGGRARPTREAEEAQLMRGFGVGVIIASLSVLMLGIAYENLRVVHILPFSGAVLGVCGMFMTIAGGIAMLITAGQRDRAHTAPHVPVTPSEQPAPQPTQVQPAVQQPAQQPAMRPAVPKWVRIVGGILTAIYWVSTVAVYLYVSAATGMWYYTWVIFVLAGGIYSIARGIVRLCCGLDWLGEVIGGFVDLGACVVYYLLTLRTGLWYVTWLVFPIAGCVNGIANGIIRLVRSTMKGDD